MNEYVVSVKEIHSAHYSVPANSQQEAIQKVLDGDTSIKYIDLEFEDTMGEETWGVNMERPIDGIPSVKKINDKSIDIQGTCFQGGFVATYDKIVSKIGPPHISYDGYKTDAEWAIEFEDETIATIYNWKDGKNYRGEDGLEVGDITEWHIGGEVGNVVEWVTDLIKDSWPVFDEVRRKAKA